MFIQLLLLVLQSLGAAVVVLSFGLLLSQLLTTRYLQSMAMEAEQEEVPLADESSAEKEYSELGDLDRMLDFVLSCIAHNLTSSSSSQPVPDVNITFPLAYGYFQVQCHLSAKNGAVDGFESLHRDGSATTTRGEAGALALDATAGLRFMRLRYAQYALRVGLVTFRGTLEAQLSPVVLRARVALSAPPAVDARLLELQVARAGALAVHATGLGVCSPLMAQAQRWLNDRMHYYLRSVAVKHLEHLVHDSLQRLSRAFKALPPAPLFQSHMSGQLLCIDGAQKRGYLEEEQEEQRKNERKLNLKRDKNSLSRFMISPSFGRPIEHQSTVPFRCHC